LETEKEFGKEIEWNRREEKRREEKEVTRFLSSAILEMEMEICSMSHEISSPSLIIE
jgi:hypothetical protein